MAAELSFVLEPDDPPGVPCDPREVAALVGRGWLRVVLPGIYLAADVPQTPVIRATAALQVMSHSMINSGVISGPSAAWVLGGVLVDGAPPWPIELTVPAGTPGVRLRNTAQVLVREQRLAAPDVEVVAGARITTAVRTAVDLARVLPPDQAVAALTALSEATGLRPAAVTGYLRRHDPVPGLRAARAAVAAWRATG